MDKVGRIEFSAMAQVGDERLRSILDGADEFVSVGLVTLACQINKSHNDPSLDHSSVTECLKGTTIRVPSTGKQATPRSVARSLSKTEFSRLGRAAESPGPLYEKKSFRLIGFSATTITFLILGYFLGGLVVSPLLGERACVGVSVSPPSLSPCDGSFVGLVVSAIGGIGYTYYYFVRKL